MKVHRILLLLCVAAATPQLATADLAVTNPAGLGQVHALLDFCSRVDPQNSVSFNAEWQSIVGNQSSLLAQIEQNSVYKREYDAFTSELNKLPRGETSTICKVSAARWNAAPGENGDDGRGKEPREGPVSRPVTDRGHEPDHEPGH